MIRRCQRGTASCVLLPAETHISHSTPTNGSAAGLASLDRVLGADHTASTRSKPVRALCVGSKSRPIVSVLVPTQLLHGYVLTTTFLSLPIAFLLIHHTQAATLQSGDKPGRI